jgi:arylsulfatase
MKEVYAGFLTHTDHHLGRLFHFLADAGEVGRTAILALSDNGASAEGGRHGSVNEGLLFNGIPDDLADNLAHIDDLGGPNTYPHYPWGWAMAGNTPFRRWKRETHEGGIADPLIVAAPGIADPGAIRPHFLHAIDVGATVLDLCGVAMPAMLNGVAQEPLAGRSFASTLANPEAPAVRETQYFEQFASRAVYHRGWKAVAYHSMGIQYRPEDDPRRPFADDEWELYHVDEDFSESRDLARENPAKLRELQDLWWAEAGKYSVLPLQALRSFARDRPTAIRPRERYVLRPGTAPVPEEAAPDVKLRPHSIVATVEVPSDGAEGVLLAQGGRFGGYSLYVQDGALRYTYNFAGLEQTTVVSPRPLGAGRHVLGAAVAPTSGTAARVELMIGSERVAAAEIPRTMPFRFALVGAGLTCGYDDGAPVSDSYAAPFSFTGTLHGVVVDVGGTPVVDLVAEAERALKTQ